MTNRGSQNPTKDDLVGFFMRHVVPVFFAFHRGDEPPKTMMMTAFVLSVGEQWFLVTAGHVIQCVRRITIEQGYSMAACRLIDALGADAKHRQPIPFAYERSHPTRLSESKSFDYGIMALSPYYRRLLEVNGVEALNEDSWKCQPANPEFYLLLGIPAELVEVEPEDLKVSPILVRVEHVDEPPPGFSETDVPRFYGRIRLGAEIGSIAGMSGGPILAFQEDARGQLRYWLVALQSSWLRESQYVAGCLTGVLGRALEEFQLSLQDQGHV